MSKSEELIQKIKDLRKLQDQKLIQLEKSLAIQKVCPDAFKHGSCTSYTKIKRTAFGNKFEAFIITKGDGSKVIITDANLLPPVLRDNVLTQRDKWDIAARKRLVERRAERLKLTEGNNDRH